VERLTFLSVYTHPRSCTRRRYPAPSSSLAWSRSGGRGVWRCCAAAAACRQVMLFHFLGRDWRRRASSSPRIRRAVGTLVPRVDGCCRCCRAGNPQSRPAASVPRYLSLDPMHPMHPIHPMLNLHRFHRLHRLHRIEREGLPDPMRALTLSPDPMHPMHPSHPMQAGRPPLQSTA
jgi:hypothetical protein